MLSRTQPSMQLYASVRGTDDEVQSQEAAPICRWPPHGTGPGAETGAPIRIACLSGEEQKKENIEDWLYSKFIVSVSWTQGEDKTKEGMLPETSTFDESLSSTVRKAAETWVTAPVTPNSVSMRVKRPPD